MWKRSVKRLMLTVPIKAFDEGAMLALPPGLDPDLLRSFVLIAEGGSFTRAAQRVGRTQSAVSMQMRRLEDMLGHPLLVRTPRGVAPTPHGAWLLERAKRLLSLHDEIITGFRTPEIAGRVRLGSPDDYALRWLPGILARFAAAHPAVELELTCSPSNELVERLEEGDLDLTLLSVGNEPPDRPARVLWRGPLRWVGSVAHETHRRSPLPLAVAHPTCVWRRAAAEALDAACIAWRPAYTSTSQIGTHALVLAGLAVTIGLDVSNAPNALLPPGLRVLGPEDGLPPLPDFAIGLLVGPGGGPATQALARHIEQSYRLEVALEA